MKLHRISFQYVNRSKDSVEIWLSVAPGTKNISFPDIQPEKYQEHSFLGKLYYFSVPNKQKLTYEAVYDPTTNPEVSKEERDYFLRNSELIQVNEEMRTKAEKITEGCIQEEEKAKAIFNYVKAHFKYSSRIKERGIQYCTTNKIGDCGELSAVIASYCRSLGIPCRIMVGAFRGRFQPHAWNEIYFENKGWIPVDVSVAMYTFLNYPLRNIGATVRWGAFSNKERYFGEIESGRVVFSIDPERKLEPAYNDLTPVKDDTVYLIGNDKIAWGYESIDGAAPYMQPIYPRLNNTYGTIKTKDLLGSFQIKANNRIDYYSYKVKIASFFLVAFFVYLNFMINFFNINIPIINMILDGGIALLLAIFSILTFIRKEFNFLILILCVLFMFSTVSISYQFLRIF